MKWLSYLVASTAANEDVKLNVSNKAKDDCKSLGFMKKILKNRGISMIAKWLLHKRILEPSVIYGLELWSMQVSERLKLNVLEIKWPNIMADGTKRDWGRNEA